MNPPLAAAAALLAALAAGGRGARPRPSRPAVDVRRLLPGGAARRQRELEAAVPEVLDVLRATVTAGLAPRRALEAAAESARDPLAAVIRRAVRAAELGDGAGRALVGAARGAGLAELQLAGEALDLAESTGAPPAPVLAAVAEAAADRLRARQARLAATAEARLSARVVGGMAPAFLLVLAVVAPSDAVFLLRDRIGWATLAAAAAFEAAGVWWAGRIVGGAG